MIRFRAVILDYGLVLCHKPTTSQVERIASVFGLAHDSFWELYEKNRGAYDRGDLTPEEYWYQFGVDAGVHFSGAMLPHLRRWDMDMWSSLNRPLIAWVDYLRATGYKTAILSNMHAEFVARLRAEAEWLRSFDCQVFSSEVGLGKPDPAIFYYCLERLNVNQDEAIFIDDRAINIKAARETGVRAIHFQSVSQLAIELSQLGFSTIPVKESAEKDRQDCEKTIQPSDICQKSKSN